MAVLYISEHGALLRISGKRFSVTMGKKRLLEIPAIKVDQVVIFGNGLMTPQAMDYLLKNNIDVSYMSTSGRYRGRLQPPLTQNLPLRRAQYKMGGNDYQCVKHSRTIVEAKIRNSIHLVVKKGRKDETCKQTARLRQLSRHVAQVKSLGRLRGLEGSASVAYFQAFRNFFKNDMGFGKRIRQPPTDPVNVLLSLGYTLLFNFVHSMINLVGLDPYQGFLHQHKHGHASLASDLMEPFRAPVVDALVLRVVNLGIIKKKDFTQNNGKLVFEKAALKRYLEEYDRKMKSKRRFEPTEKNLDFMQIIEWQCRQFARALLGKEREIKPYLWGGI